MDQYALPDSAIDAVKNDQLETLKIIANSIPEDKRSEILSQRSTHGETTLNEAIKSRNLTCVKFLLEDCHVDPSVKEEVYHGNYPLTNAARKGDLVIVKLLLESGAKLNLFDEKDYISPLSYRNSVDVIRNYRENFKEIATFLIEKGEDINKSNCLITAIFNGNDELIKYILDCGADINARDSEGLTPLFASSWKENLELTKVLIDRGANIEARFKGMDALQWAAICGREKLVNFHLKEEFYTHEKVLDCVEILGIEAAIANDLTSAILFWLKVKKERSDIMPIENFQNNLNVDLSIVDVKSVAIHAIKVLERVLEIDSELFFSWAILLLKKIPIENIKVWNSILIMRNENFNLYYHQILKLLVKKFEIFVKSCSHEKSLYSVVDMILRTLDDAFDFLQHSKDSYDERKILMFCIRLCISFSKETLTDFQKQHFSSIMKHFVTYYKFRDKSIIHLLIETKDLSEDELQDNLEFFCKLTETVNVLDSRKESPLYSAIKRDKNGKCVDILLKHGSLTDIRNIYGNSIRNLAATNGRSEICLGSPTLQGLIAYNRYNFLVYKIKNCPGILMQFMMFH